MGTHTPHLNLYLAAGGSSGDPAGDEDYDVDNDNNNMRAIDTWAATVDTGIDTAKRTRRGLDAVVSVSSGSFTQLADGSYQFTNAAGITLDNVFDGLASDTYQIIIRTESVATGIKLLGLRKAGASTGSAFYFVGNWMTATGTTGSSSILASNNGSGFAYLMPASTATTSNTGFQVVDISGPMSHGGGSINYHSHTRYMAVVGSTPTQYDMLESGRPVTGADTADGFALLGYTAFSGNVKIVRK